MANSKKKCRHCKEYSLVESGITVPLGFFCSIAHAQIHGSAQSNKARALFEKKAASLQVKKQKALKSQIREAKKKARTRTEWFKILQKVVNQWVRYRDRNEPCCTCGTTNDIKYDAGHFYTVAARPDIRFELTNIHRQCSMKCNQHGSGMRAEYKVFIVEKYGQDHLDWLESEKAGLKTQFPHWSDIEAEITKYRAMLRAVGITPR
tara:strand:- start:64 stop:681 length:618 start_codon:yes stop_codon:yes gene_type:complete